MSDMYESVGGVTHVVGTIGNPQSPDWLVCGHPTRQLDWFATWHAHGCPTCLELADTLAATRGDEPRVKWLLEHLKNPDEVAP